MNRRDVNKEVRGLLEEALPEEALPEEKSRRRWPIAFFVVVIFVTIVNLSWSTYTAYTKPSEAPIIQQTVEIPQDKPWGKIISPAPGLPVPRSFKISGETGNIPDGHKLVLVVDVERLRLCWPHKPFIEPNTMFKTEFYEGGPEGEFTVSLYAMDKRYFTNIKEWFDGGIVGGIPLIPSRYLLDSVVLNVKS